MEYQRQAAADHDLDIDEDEQVVFDEAGEGEESDGPLNEEEEMLENVTLAWTSVTCGLICFQCETKDFYRIPVTQQSSAVTAFLLPMRVKMHLPTRLLMRNPHPARIFN